MNAVKPFLDWVKAHYIVAALLVVGILAVPAAAYFSQDWSATIQKKAQKDVGDLATGLKTTNISYKVEALIPGQAAIEDSKPPNQVVINHFSDLRAQQAKSAAEVVTHAISINKTGREVLVPGLFPEPSQQEDTIKRRDFSRAFYGDGLRALLRKHRADGPRDAAVLAVELNETARQIAQVDPGQQIPPEKKDLVEKRLWETRIRAYQAHAKITAIYGEMSTFRLPQVVEEPSLRDCFDFQQQYWIFDDIFSIAEAANSGQSQPGVPGAVVKRIVSIDVEPMRIPAPSGDASGAAPAGDPTAPDFRASITGRVGGNSLYDIRYANTEMVVATTRIPTLLDAVSRNRFVSVVGLSIDKVEVLDDLKLGYFYGDDNVVRVRMRLETVWLRDWLKDVMPADIKSAFGLTPPAGADPNAPAAPAAPATPPGAPNPERSGKGRAVGGG